VLALHVPIDVRIAIAHRERRHAVECVIDADQELQPVDAGVPSLQVDRRPRAYIWRRARVVVERVKSEDRDWQANFCKRPAIAAAIAAARTIA